MSAAVPAQGESGRAACLGALTTHLQARRAGDLPVGLIVLRATRLERAYAGLGYAAASALYRELLNRLERAVGPADSLIALDECSFAVVLGALRSAGHAALAANRFAALCETPLVASGREVPVSPRIGVAVGAEEFVDAQILLQQAEMAMQSACEREESFVIHSAGDSNEVVAAWDLEAELDQALERGDLELYYQPKVLLPGCSLGGVEALMRWCSATRGFVSPDVFIPLAEQTGQIAQITRFAIQAALRQLHDWSQQLPELAVAVNVSPSMIQTDELADVLQAAAGIWNVPLRRLTLEVTEAALMKDPTASHDVLTRLRAMGCRIAIDDFGTGYSSLSYFKHIPADELKIDKSFVMSMLEDTADRAIVTHIISLAHCFGLKVVAEGVESAAIMAELAKLGCDSAQGYHLSKPLPAGGFIRWAVDRADERASPLGTGGFAS